MLPSLESLHGTIVPTNADTPLVIGQQPTPAAQSLAGSASGRFEILSAHARGGLGQVSIALDKELHRQVAVKEIHPGLADHAESRARFLLEAEVTGSLEHPGVVPVYSLGTWPDGRPYYAMRLIRGKSLEEAVRQFHEWPSDEGEHELKLRKLLRRFIDICNAVDYGWFQGNSAGSLRQSLSLKPTGRGLVSVHGNVGEWCHDWLGFIPGGAGTDPIGAFDGPCRALRGGSYLSLASQSRSASRSGLPPDFAAPYSGIRLVRTLPNGP